MMTDCAFFQNGPRSSRIAVQRVVALWLALGLHSAPLRAGTVISVGENGDAGANAGTIEPDVFRHDGKPGDAGGAGLAVATTPSDETNVATAIGGAGGAGGFGAMATQGGFWWGGYGGHGGPGNAGRALATTERTEGAATATATARGGAGGNGGRGGDAPAEHLLGGGNGGWGAAGGGARATAVAATTVGTVQSTASAEAGGGGVGGLGGYGLLENGTGGKGQMALGAQASASGTNTSAHPVNVFASASGGAGGYGNRFHASPGADGGIASLGEVRGVSTGGGNVTVSATLVGGRGGNGSQGGSGASIDLTDAISGSTSGRLTLQQSARGGSGGSGFDLNDSGTGGSASSSLTVTDTSASTLVLTSNAIGGAGGGIGYSSGASGGTAIAELHAAGVGDVEASVAAGGGTGGEGYSSSSPGRAAIVKSSSAVTTGDARTVRLSANQAGGAGGGSTGDGSPSRGADSSLENVISGSAPGGLLHLTQVAKGGDGGVAQNGGAGAGGDATSKLIMPGGNPGGGTFEATAQAIGGGVLLSSNSPSQGNPGTATADCDVHHAGNVDARAIATPGMMYKGGAFHSSGEANATASATATRPFSIARAFASTGNFPSTDGACQARSASLGGIITEISASVEGSSMIAQYGLSALSTVADKSTGSSVNALGLPTFHAYPFDAPPAPNTAAALQGTKTLAGISFSGGMSAGSAAVTMNTSGLTGSAKLILLNGGGREPVGTTTSVLFQVTAGGNTILSESLDNLTEMTRFFDDHVFDLGSVSSLDGQRVTFSIELTGAAANTSIFAKMVVVAQESPVAVWAESFALAHLDRLPEADPDGDGLSNLMEYAFGLNPTNGGSVDLPSGEMIGGSYVFTFEQPAGVIDIIYLAECSSSLAPNSWLPVTDTGTGGTHTFSIPVDASERCFVRFNILGP